MTKTINRDIENQIFESEIIKAMREDGLIVFEVSRIEIETRDLRRVNDLLQILQRYGDDAKDSLILLFGGYDFDPRELYEIPEIRDYVYRIFRQTAEIFFYLIPEPNYAFVYCLLDLQRVSTHGKEATLSIEMTPRTQMIMMMAALGGFDFPGLQRAS